VAKAKIAARAMPVSLTLRIVVVDPPMGVAWALQIGKDALEPPSAGTGNRIIFTAQVRASRLIGKSFPRFLGAAVKGPPDRRFLYLNSGARAGQANTLWDRRAKVPLWQITWPMINSVASRKSRVLEAQISGLAKDGGPACASVTLLKGWQLK
jgi:hypothetical protein